MEDSILGIHHITAIAGEAQRNYDFYTKVLGLRLVKKTVNFDDPGTYHFYFGNEQGTPGTILTFFPWTYVKRGTIGTGMVTSIGYAVPKGSLSAWTERLRRFNVVQQPVFERLGEMNLPFEDPDGLVLHLIESSTTDDRPPWITSDIDKSIALKGFHNATLMLHNIVATADILTGVFGYRLAGQEGNISRFITDAIGHAAIIDIIEAPDEKPGIVAGGTNHHIAFRVKDEDTLMRYREKIEALGLHITPKIDRNYFYSLYFREPGGVLFEIATDNPGFNIDEPVNELGTHLKLPPQYEAQRSRIENILPALTQ